MQFLTAILFALPLLAAASPLSTRTDGACSQGTFQCCQQSLENESDAGKAIINQFGWGNHAVDGSVVGTQCNAFGGILNGGTCNSKSFCCSMTGNLVAVGCFAL